MLDCLNHRRCLTSSTIFEFFLFIENKVFVLRRIQIDKYMSIRGLRQYHFCHP